MKFMITWKIPPALYKAAIERFLNTGAPDPTGVKTIGRWHTPGSFYGWHVVEGDAAGVAELECLTSVFGNTSTATFILLQRTYQMAGMR
jgi:Protein of unknown function (DUF3303)